MNQQITHATREDLEAILELQKLAYEKEARRYNDFNIPPMTQTLEEIESEYGSTVFLMMTSGSIIIGSIKGKKINDTCHVGRLMVHPLYRGNGYGKKLVEELEKIFSRDKEIRFFELFTGEKSSDNISLYKSLGYREFRAVPAGNGYNILYLRKKIS